MISSRLFHTFLFLVFFSSIDIYGQLSTSKLIGDHMVLQRNIENPIWGWATAGAPVEVEFAGKSLRATADATGKWEVKLPTLEAGGPFLMTIKSGEEVLTIEDILIGEVWVCSGQSNMEWVVANSNDAQAVIAAATDTQIRHFKVPRKGSISLEHKLPGGEWEVNSPETAGQFTAVGYFFAQHLREKLGVPIGLINSSWGGSALEAWTSPEVQFKENPQEGLSNLKNQMEAERLRAIKKLEAIAGELPKKDPGMDGDQAIWAAAGLNDSNWKQMELPQLWEEAGLEGLDGIVWFRKKINLSKEAATKGIELHLAKIDDSDQVWVNGQIVGGLKNAYNVDRIYKVDPKILKTGENSITIRVEDTGGGGGVYGSPEQMYYQIEDMQQSLNGTWKFKVGRFSQQPNQVHHTPTMLYNHMIHPMLGYGIKGVIWYQGETNATGRRAFTYREQFPAMIENWRKNWKQGDFPFLFVQLANYQAPEPEPGDHPWAVLRESQTKTLESCPNTGMAVIIDIGEAGDIHPRNKQDVGWRLALAARKIAYNQDLVFSGPLYKSHKIEGNKIRIQFAHTGSGLMARDKYGYLKGFAVAGADKKFVWAKASIDGDEVTVWSDAVKQPVAVRYGWAVNPDDVNLYNKESLPASPFRTDEW